MGSNSHLSIEIRNAIESNDEEWFLWAKEVFELPCYPIYAAMADVRNYFSITPVSQPRGLPADASEWARDFHESYSDDFAFTWLSPAEYHEAFKRGTVQRQRGEDKEWEALGRVLLVLAEAYGDANVRLLASFCN